MNENEQQDTSLAIEQRGRGQRSLIRFGAVIFTLVWVIISFLPSSIGVIPWIILAWVIVQAFRKGASAETRAKARLFLRTVLWTVGILVLLAVLLVGTCLWMFGLSGLS